MWLSVAAYESWHKGGTVIKENRRRDASGIGSARIELPLPLQSAHVEPRHELCALSLGERRRGRRARDRWEEAAQNEQRSARVRESVRKCSGRVVRASDVHRGVRSAAHEERVRRGGLEERRAGRGRAGDGGDGTRGVGPGALDGLEVREIAEWRLALGPGPAVRTHASGLDTDAMRGTVVSTWGGSHRESRCVWKVIRGHKRSEWRQECGGWHVVWENRVAH